MAAATFPTLRQVSRIGRDGYPKRTSATAGFFPTYYCVDERRIAHDDAVAEAVVESDGTIVAIEIKLTASVRDADLNALQYLRDRLGDRFAAGIVLYTGQHTLPFGDQIAVVLLCALWQ